MKTYLNKLQIKSFAIYNRYKNNLFLKNILKIASYFFLIGYKLRLALYKSKQLKSYTLPAYVISIGNITSGGTGKTPISIELAKHFISQGYKVAILSRGYKAKVQKTDGVLLVSDGEEILTDYDRAGDEPYLIANKIPKALVIVNKDRVEAGRVAIKLGANILILDDGFQYLRLERDENILILDSYAPFDDGNLLPLGKLRELPDSISRATSIIISNSDRKKLSDNDLKTIKKYGKDKPLLKINYNLINLSGLNTKKIIEPKGLRQMKVLACCGIANPESFLDLLARHEINILSHIAYPDHHNYEYGDIEEIITLAKKYGVEDIITTEKDAVKIEDLCQGAPISFWKTNIEVAWDTLNPYEKLLVKKEKLRN